MNTNGQHNFKAIQQNIGRNKIALDQLCRTVIEENVNISFVQEPYLFGGLVLPHSSIHIFCCIDSPRAAIIAPRSVPILFLPQLSSRDICTCEVSIANTKVLFISVYFSPNEDIEIQLRHLELVLQRSDDMPIVIGGDFNGHHSSWGSDSSNLRGRKIHEFIASNEADLTLLNRGNDPTFYAIRAGIELKSIVDITLVSKQLLNQNWSWKVSDDETASDHQLIRFGFSLYDDEPHLKMTTRKWKTSNIEWSAFSEKIVNKRDEWIEQIQSCTSAAEMDNVTSVVMKDLTSICDMTIPMMSTTKRRVPWWSAALTEMRKIAKQWRRRVQRASAILKSIYIEIYLQHKANYQKAITAAKFDSYKRQLESIGAETPLSKAFRLCRPAKAPIPQAIRKDDDTFTNDSLSTAEYLLDCFQPDDCLIDAQCHSTTRMAANSNNTGTANDIQFSLAEIESVIKQLNDKKSPGEDGITANIVKSLFEAAPEILTSLFNGCLHLACFPSWFKRSLIRAIPKSSDADLSLAKNWRPISLLPVLGKVLEKLMIERILFNLRDNKLLSDDQFGFTPTKSTIDPIRIAVEFIQRVRSNSSRSKVGVLVSLDISGAFNAAWWPAILSQLVEKKVHNNLVELCRSYLSQRTASLEISTARASKRVTRGAPQGSACGPGLWNILYDSILKLTLPPNCRIVTFADDALLMASARSIEELERTTNEALKIITDWGDSVKLKYNEKKTQAMLIHRRRNIDAEFFMLGKRLQLVNHFKYLGVVIDNKLTWKQHINYLETKVQKIYSRVHHVARNTWGISSNVSAEIYKSVIEPILLYAIQVWHQSLDKKWARQRLRMIQRWFLLRICKAYRTVSFDALCVIANIPPIDYKAKSIAELSEVHTNGLLALNDLSQIEIQQPQLRLCHPAKSILNNACIYYQSAMKNETESINIFTDGSKSDNGVGSAFVAFHRGTLFHRQMFKLPNHCTVFQAELLAIHEALLFARSISQGRTVRIYSDSLSSLMAINDRNSKSELVLLIQDTIKGWNGPEIELHWIKAHVGHEGNEIADQLAKEASISGQSLTIKAPMSYAKKVIKDKMKSTWDHEWAISPNGKWTKTFFPNLATRRQAAHFAPDFISTQFITEHGKFNAYLNRFHIRRTDHCKCSELNRQTCRHLLCECPDSATEREPLLQYCDDYEEFFSTAYSRLETAEELKTVFHNIHNKLTEWESDLMAASGES